MPRRSRQAPKALRALGMLLLGSAITTASGQDSALDMLTAQLNSTDLRERQNAAQRIMRLGTISLGEVEAELRKPGLSPEARVRLEQVAEALFAASPRAGLGVRFGGEFGDTVTLAGVVDDGNFPAAKLLQGGDVFLEVDGHTTVTQDWLRNWIVSHAPGETMQLRILRGGEELELVVPLGSFENLGNNAALDRVTIARAYRLRQERLNQERPPELTLGETLNADAWIRAAYPQARYELDPRPIAINTGHHVAGHSSDTNITNGWTARSLHLLHAMSLTGRGYPKILPEGLRADWQQQLERQFESYSRRAKQLTDLLGSRNRGPADLQNLQSQIETARMQAELTEAQLAELESLPKLPQN